MKQDAKFLAAAITDLNTSIAYFHAFNKDNQAEQLEKAQKIMMEVFDDEN